MEQSGLPQEQVLMVEEIQTDGDAQATQNPEQDTKTAFVTEGQNLPKVYKLPSESVLTVDNANIHIVVASEDYMDASHSVSTKEVDDGTNIQVKSEVPSKEPKLESCKSEEIEIYDTVEEVNSNHESQYLSNEEDQSLNVITESKIIKGDKEATGSLENDCNIIGDANQSNIVDKQEVALDESRLSEHGGHTRDSYESVEETIKETHDNNGNQNNSIVTNAELTKLVQGETEVVVVVETIPIATDTTADNFIVTLEEKDANNECSQENVTLQEKQIEESDHGNNEINLIDYGQESDDTTIIEVTEVIDTPLAEQYKEQNNTDYTDNNKCNTKSVKLIDEKIAIDESINDENTEVKTTDKSKTSISSGKEDKEDITIIIDEKIIITEVPQKTTDLSQIENTHKDAIKEMTEHKQDDKFTHKVSAVDSLIKKRSVIQDIFDDWGVENTDEDVQSTSKVHDSVEIELKSLLDETKTDQIVSNESVVAFQEKVPSANEDGTYNIMSTTKKSTTKQSMENQKKSKAINKDAVSLNKSEKNSSASPASRSSRSMDSHAVNATSHDTVVPKSRSRHLTSQIASPAEVTEVLKERFREKQKRVDAPRGPDIFFVKKLTQRLSSKLAGGPINPIPKLIPLPQQTASSNPPSSTTAQSASANCDKKTEVENTTTEPNKDGNSDNKELLAILEGDIDPDWSILKPPVLTEESKASLNVEPSEQSNPPKLDPLVERELALKQLLELPITSKKIPSRKKKTFRAAPSKASKDTTTVAKTPLSTQRKEANTDLASENAQPNTKSVETDLSSREKSGQKNQEQISTRIEESRSGRKRKPTEKAREHEQNTIKRQKVYRGKVSISKKQMEEKPVSSDDSTIKNHITASDATNVDVNNEKTIAKQSEDKVDPTLNKVEDSPLKRSKSGFSKKGPIAKRKMVVKRLLRQKMPIDNSVELKTKLTSSKKTPPKAVSKSPKRMTEGPSGDVKPKKKNINEIDRLLQDEGVVNLLYDVEQPDRKRLVPITKSRAKVMDLQKVQRELKIRKKLVRNAVLRLRTSTVASVTKVSPRSKRTSIHSTDVQIDKKMVEQIASRTAASPTEFILPAKIRNAADASIIVRRHSSSSFSSASGSPRVSVDSPEKSTEATKSEDGTVHSLRSAKKRRDSQEEKINSAKKKKKTVQKDIDITATSTTATTTTTVANNPIANNAEEKVTVARPGKKSEIKKVDKIGKQENIPAIEDNVSSKVTTRSSNGAVTGKVTAKSKKAMKSKVTFARTNVLNNADNSLKEEDELSACLAEAATALSVVNAKNVATTRKSKGKGKHF